MTSMLYCTSFALTGECDDEEFCQLPHISPNIIYALKSVQRRSNHSPKIHRLVEVEEFLKDSGFIYDATQPMMSEFYRMCGAFGWEGYVDGKEIAKAIFTYILAREFLEDSQENTGVGILEQTSTSITGLKSPLMDLPDCEDSPLQVGSDGPPVHDYFFSGDEAADSFDFQPNNEVENTGPSLSPLEEFFMGFAPFEYDPREAATQEFSRLTKFYGWGSDSPEKINARECFKDAIAMEFNSIYGTNENDINVWHGLCRVLDVLPLPETLELCKEKVEAIHVNLIDLTCNPNWGKPVRKFPSELALSQYTREENKIYPKGSAYAGGLLKWLLRHIFHPPPDPSCANY